MQEREFKHREEKMRRNQESMLKAFQAGADMNEIEGGGGSRQSLSEMEQIKLMRDEYEHENSRLARKVKDLEEKLRTKEYDYNCLSVQVEEKEIAGERKLYDLQLDKRNLENKIKRLENELMKANNQEKAAISAKSDPSEVSALRSRLE